MSIEKKLKAVVRLDEGITSGIVSIVIVDHVRKKVYDIGPDIWLGEKQSMSIYCSWWKDGDIQMEETGE